MQTHINLYNELKNLKLKVVGKRKLPKYIIYAEWGYSRVKYDVNAELGLGMLEGIITKRDLYYTYMNILATAPLEKIYQIISNDQSYSPPDYLDDLRIIVGVKKGLTNAK